MGTLDSLMQLSDDLVRIDMLVENMVRKIEKQYTEVAGESPEALKVSLLNQSIHSNVYASSRLIKQLHIIHQGILST